MEKMNLKLYNFMLVFLSIITSTPLCKGEFYVILLPPLLQKKIMYIILN